MTFLKYHHRLYILLEVNTEHSLAHLCGSLKLTVSVSCQPCLTHSLPNSIRGRYVVKRKAISRKLITTFFAIIHISWLPSHKVTVHRVLFPSSAGSACVEPPFEYSSPGVVGGSGGKGGSSGGGGGGGRGIISSILDKVRSTGKDESNSSSSKDSKAGSFHHPITSGNNKLYSSCWFSKILMYHTHYYDL